MARGLLNSALLCGLCTFMMTGGAANADQTNYTPAFFKEINSGFRAYLDLNNQTTDAAGNRVVNVKADTFSDSFRKTAKDNWPGAEKAAYAIERFSINCSAKQVGELQIAFYDQNGFPLTKASELGVNMRPPVERSLNYFLMQKVCGE